MNNANHETFIKQSFALAREAVKKGNHPFGALLAQNGQVILTAENSVNTRHDCTRHAELNLVSAASQKFNPETLTQSVLYTSTEPCPMCAGAIYWAGISTVVFGCSAKLLGEIAGETLAVMCRDIFSKGGRKITVVGPILEDLGAEIHRDYW